MSACDALLVSFIGDAIALGPHWIYDQEVIAREFAGLDGYRDPATKYHPGKSAGDFTHYGDQALLVLRSIAAHGGFDLAQFASRWRAYWENPDTISYCDKATKATLANLQSGKPLGEVASSSSDLGGAARIAPLFLLPWPNDGELIAAARQLTGFTHGDPAVIESAEFFTRVALAVLRGGHVGEALKNTASLWHWNAIQSTWFEKSVISSASTIGTAAALKEHGLSCDIADAFPSVCHLLLRHHADPRAALLENALAGGDSAARGLIIGLVLGARHQAESLPAQWISALKARGEIEALMQAIASGTRPG